MKKLTFFPSPMTPEDYYDPKRTEVGYKSFALISIIGAVVGVVLLIGHILLL